MGEKKWKIRFFFNLFVFKILRWEEYPIFAHLMDVFFSNVDFKIHPLIWRTGETPMTLEIYIYILSLDMYVYILLIFYVCIYIYIHIIDENLQKCIYIYVILLHAQIYRHVCICILSICVNVYRWMDDRTAPKTNQIGETKIKRSMVLWVSGIDRRPHHGFLKLQILGHWIC